MILHDSCVECNGKFKKEKPSQTGRYFYWYNRLSEYRTNNLEDFKKLAQAALLLTSSPPDKKRQQASTFLLCRFGVK